MTVTLHPNLAKKPTICTRELSTVLLDETKVCPWILLVPRRAGVYQITDLSSQDQHTLIDEIDHCSRVMHALFAPERLNVGVIGNITPQLHIHIICRYASDPHWPDVCWNKPMIQMSAHETEIRVAHLRKALQEDRT